MRRGDLYRVFLVVSNQELIDNTFSSVICAPVYSKYHGITTQVKVGVEEGLKHDSAIWCDTLMSLPKTILTNYISSLPNDRMEAVNAALRIALAVG